jgi:hypothetical protein
MKAQSPTSSFGHGPGANEGVVHAEFLRQWFFAGGETMFELEEVGRRNRGNSTVIKVVGVGGAGGNAVDHMIREGRRRRRFICCNTDSQALNRSIAPSVKLQLGKTGLGAGGKPEKGAALAIEERERIAEALGRAHGLHHRRHGRRHRYRCRPDRRRGGARTGHPDRGRGDQALRFEGKR